MSLEEPFVSPTGPDVHYAPARASVDSKNLDDSGPPATDIAEKAGWYAYDVANSAFFYGTINMAALLLFNMANASWHLNNPDNTEEEPDMTVWMIIPVKPETVSQVCVFISVFVQLIVFLSCGSMADYGNYRKLLLLSVNTVSSVLTLLVFAISNPNHYWIVGWCIIISNVGFGFCLICYNAYLPLIIAAEPEMVGLELEGNYNKYQEESTARATYMSTIGFAGGFGGAVAFLVISAIWGFFAIPQNPTDEDKSSFYRSVIFFGGAWALVVGNVSILLLKDRPGKKVPPGENFASLSIKNLYNTFTTLKEMRQLAIFLGAYFIFSDGVSTSASSAATFADKELGMSPESISVALILVLTMAGVGCLAFRALERAFEFRPKTMLVTSLILLGLTPFYAIFLTKPSQFFFLSAWFGFGLGPQQSYTRSIFSSCVPNGREAEYFALYEFTDKGTSWLGPVVIVTVNSITGSFRDAYGAIIIFYVIGLGILFFFDHDKALVEKEAHRHTTGVTPPGKVTEAMRVLSRSVRNATMRLAPREASVSKAGVRKVTLKAVHHEML